MDQPPVHFDDTAVAFSYKSNKDLRKANFIFTVVNYSFLSGLATRAVKWAFNLRIPIKRLIRNTVFEHFCGGETIAQCDATIHKLWEFHVGTILDYSVEGAKTEEGFDGTTEEILRTIDRARGNASVPFSVFKVTGLATMELLERMSDPASASEHDHLSFDKVRKRVDRICEGAFRSDVRVLIDAEDSWIQDAIDRLANEMMAKYNLRKSIVFNTFQMYRSDMLGNLKKSHEQAVAGNYFLGAKLVRGAYMEKERARAAKMGYTDPINPNKEATDKLFNEGIRFCIENRDRVSFMCGSHNEQSNAYLAELIRTNALSAGDERIWFGQLLGMSDNISFNLAKQGFNVAKYVPYGPVSAVMPYLLRRAAENTSVAGQSSRELTLIRKELHRRKHNGQTA